ncbi:hypothetical protein PsorP6_009626 [Peronosclerospora sorghi]|uniref:Uncharacterized protein n=1 Tax=Peronosclerospora sorghi TaxID=230839 RepID=A0ACC0VXU1_9STRA|nr:hypothetical protein PsorP6_009626 [Peronosclerospora sorghi]
MQEIWRSNELPAPLETDVLEQHNLSTRTEREALVEVQTACILEEKRADQLQTQEHAQTHTKERELNANQVEIEVLQAEKSRREPVLQQLFEKNGGARCQDESVSCRIREAEYDAREAAGRAHKGTCTVSEAGPLFRTFGRSVNSFVDCTKRNNDVYEAGRFDARQIGFWCVSPKLTRRTPVASFISASRLIPSLKNTLVRL